MSSRLVSLIAAKIWSEGGKIFGNNLLIDKNKKIFTISNNVVYKDSKNLLTIRAEEINFYEISNLPEFQRISRYFSENAECCRDLQKFA